MIGTHQRTQEAGNAALGVECGWSGRRSSRAVRGAQSVCRHGARQDWQERRERACSRASCLDRRGRVLVRQRTQSLIMLPQA